MDRTQLIEHIFRQFDTDGGDSLSFKEFALALWTFASLDVAGIGRFTYEIYKNEERDGIDGQGVNEFLSGVFGRKGSANAGRARNELETLRRAEGGVIDRYDFEEFIETNAKSSLGPLVRMHRVLQGKTLGLKFWEKAHRDRDAHFGTIEWSRISKSLRQADLREDDREVGVTKHTFQDCVSAAFHHAQHKNSILEKDYDNALNFCQKNLERKAGDRGDEHPVYVDVQVARDAIDALETLKASEHRKDNRLSREEWTECFTDVWREKERRRQLLLDPKPPKRKLVKQKFKKGQQVKKRIVDEYIMPPRAHCPPTRPQTNSAMQRENRHQKLVWKMHRQSKRRTEARQSYAGWAPSMGLPEAPEARATDRPKPEMGSFFDLGGEKPRKAIDSSGKEEKKVTKPKKAKMLTPTTSFGRVRVSKARASGNASVGNSVGHRSHLSVPSLRCAGGDLNLRWDMTVATGSHGGSVRSRPVRPRSSHGGASGSASVRSSFSGGASVRSMGSTASRRPKSAGASTSSRSIQSRRVV